MIFNLDKPKIAKIEQMLEEGLFWLIDHIRLDHASSIRKKISPILKMLVLIRIVELLSNNALAFTQANTSSTEEEVLFSR